MLSHHSLADHASYFQELQQGTWRPHQESSSYRRTVGLSCLQTALTVRFSEENQRPTAIAVCVIFVWTCGKIRYAHVGAISRLCKRQKCSPNSGKQRRDFLFFSTKHLYSWKDRFHPRLIRKARSGNCLFEFCFCVCVKHLTFVELTHAAFVAEIRTTGNESRIPLNIYPERFCVFLLPVSCTRVHAETFETVMLGQKLMKSAAVIILFYTQYSSFFKDFCVCKDSSFVKRLNFLTLILWICV